ncbi:MAG: hypothetical protein ETSY2_42005 [Candidatus Entotheonella gemina]|uniref:N-acetyltransferase domain-containing protein n=1 Tax=Candidatus Entotheonella gemina TaxID=1429439 RepID=W4LMI0_9BACT|nr:MAG: hypothetical protein ETSY2_42005 [Candidatus Entotheonella gemina]
MERRGVPGVALRIETRTVGYAYYVISGRLGVLAGLDLSPAWAGTEAAETLVQAAIHRLRQHNLTRIESPFLSFDCAWLLPAFEADGFRTFWREFLRLDLDERLDKRLEPPKRLPSIQLEPWRSTHLPEAAAIMQAAYDGEADTEMSVLYRTVEGCRLVLEQILHQRNSGVPVDRASVFVRHRGQGVGFIVITEIAPQQGHLAQVAVLPAYQRQGIGHLLLNYSLSQLAALEFATLSLIVSRCNARAFGLYQAMGFQAVLAFPVFAWEPEI